MHRKRGTHSFLVGLAITLTLASCVSKSTYRELEQEKLNLEHQLQLARAEKETLRAQLDLQRMQSLEDLKIKLAACRERVLATQQASERLAKESSEKGYWQGVAELHRSIQITGHSYSTGWWVFSDHYYTVDVSVAGHSLFRQSFETEDEENGIIEALGTLATLRELVPYTPKL